MARRNRREMAIFRLTVQNLICIDGIPDKQIAHRLSVSEMYVAYIVKQLMVEWGVKTRTQMVIAYWKQQLQRRVA
jgi:DNA-binding CsgD family transcriptional regulator